MSPPRHCTALDALYRRYLRAHNIQYTLFLLLLCQEVDKCILFDFLLVFLFCNMLPHKVGIIE